MEVSLCFVLRCKGMNFILNAKKNKQKNALFFQKNEKRCIFG